MTAASHIPDKHSQRNERRQQIIAAAEALIVAEGLEGFRIRDVAQRAGLHHATLLHYFPTREALIRAVISRLIVELDQVPGADASTTALAPGEALHAHLQHVLATMQQHPERFVVFHELQARAMRDTEVRSVLATTDASWRSYLVPLLTAGVRAGALRADLDLDAAATLIISCFRGLATQLPDGITRGAAAVDVLEQSLQSTNQPVSPSMEREGA